MCRYIFQSEIWAQEGQMSWVTFIPGSTWDSKLRFMVDPQQTLRDLIAVVPLMNVVFCSHRLCVCGGKPTNVGSPGSSPGISGIREEQGCAVPWVATSLNSWPLCCTSPGALFTFHTWFSWILLTPMQEDSGAWSKSAVWGDRNILGCLSQPASGLSWGLVLEVGPSWHALTRRASPPQL